MPYQDWKINSYSECIVDITQGWSMLKRFLTNFENNNHSEVFLKSNFYQNKIATAWLTDIGVYIISMPYPVWSFWAFFLCWIEASVRVTRGMPMAASLSSSSPNLISWGTALLKHCINQTKEFSHFVEFQFLSNYWHQLT